MNTKSSFFLLSLIFIFCALFQFLFLKMEGKKWVLDSSKLPCVQESLKDSPYHLTQWFTEHMGEGLLGTPKDLALMKLQDTMKVLSVCDRMDQPSCLSISLKDQLFNCEFQKRIPLSDLALEAQSEKDLELSFELEESHIRVHLYERGNRVGSFFMDFSPKQPSLDSLKDLNEQTIQWFGKDLFFSSLAKSEYPDLLNAERVDFNSKQTGPYSLFIREKESLIYEEGQWKSAQHTKNKPLLYLHQKSPEQLSFIYWSADGKIKKSFQVSKSQSSSYHRHPKMTFVGLKTSSTWIVLCEEERATLKVNDLWMFEEGKWKKLASKEQFMNYLSFKKSGDLFVIQELLEKKGKRQVRGIWFNSQRCHKKTLSFSI